MRLDERRTFTGIAGREVLSAKLRLWADEGSSEGVTAYVVDPTLWSHATLTWNNQPTLGAQLGAAQSAESGTWVVFDVADSVASNGTYGFGISEAANDPELVIVVKNP